MPDLRVVVVGAGLAGALLAWRLQHLGVEVGLVGAGYGGRAGDATAVSGGLVRRFEADQLARELASASLAELLGEPWLAAAAGFRAIGSLYLLEPGKPPPAEFSLLTAAQIERRHGLAGLPAETIGVWEPDAGHIQPDQLRHAIAAQVKNAEPVPLARLAGEVVVLQDGRRLTADAIVLATGRWTPTLLRSAGLATSLRTKHIQYSWFAVGGSGLPAFVDETSGLYGRPTGDGWLLLGLPGTRWDIDPDEPEPDSALAARVEAVARERLPRLASRTAASLVSAADCYSDPPGLALRHVSGALHTFTGGSGGAAKTALAASRLAALALVEGRR